MAWYSIQKDGEEINCVFVMSQHDLDNQLTDGQTAVEVESPLVSMPKDK